MIELLILYAINKREKTIYAIRKDIIELFGTFTKPSIGTIYPALKRLLDAKAVQFNERISNGGRKSSLYSLTKTGREYFKQLFFNAPSENPSVFFNHLQARLGTMGLLSKEDKQNFITEYLKRADFFIFDLENKLKDEYSDFDYYQRQLITKTLKDLHELQDYLNALELD